MMNRRTLLEGCRRKRRPYPAQSSCQRPDIVEDEECRLRTRTVC